MRSQFTVLALIVQVYATNALNAAAYDDDYVETDETGRNVPASDYNSLEVQEEYLPHEKKCQLYYVFEGEEGMLLSCPRRELFDSKLKRCAKASHVHCGNRKKPKDDSSSSEESSEEVLPSLKCRSHGFNYSHEHYCHLYYDCTKKHARLLRCPKGSVFDVYSGSCKYRDLVNCGYREDPYKEEIEAKPTKSKGIVIKCSGRTGIFPHPTDCEKFVRCWLGIAYVDSCPLGYLFDDYWLRCYYAENVECGNRENPYDRRPPTITTRVTTAPSTVKTTATSIVTKPPPFVCLSSNGKYPDEVDCGAFHDCKKRKLKTHYCPKNSLYDVKKKRCEREDEVDCGNRIHPDDDPHDLPDKIVDPNPNVRCKTRHGKTVHNKYCDWYYHCKDKKATTRECKRGFYFDSRSKKCREADKVNCNGRAKPEERETTTTSSTVIITETTKSETATTAATTTKTTEDTTTITPSTITTTERTSPTTTIGTTEGTTKIVLTTTTQTPSVPTATTMTTTRPTEGTTTPTTTTEIASSTTTTEGTTITFPPTTTTEAHSSTTSAVITEGTTRSPATTSSTTIFSTTTAEATTTKATEETAKISTTTTATTTTVTPSISTASIATEDHSRSTATASTGTATPTSITSESRSTASVIPESTTTSRTSFPTSTVPTEQVTSESTSGSSTTFIGTGSTASTGQVTDSTLEVSTISQETVESSTVAEGTRSTSSSGPVTGSSSNTAEASTVTLGTDTTASTGSTHPTEEVTNESNTSLPLTSPSTADSTTLPTTPSENVTSTVVDSFVCGEDGKYPHLNDCSLFYNCWNKVVTLHKCPKGELFHSVMRLCYREDWVNCENRKRPEIEGTTNVYSTTTESPINELCSTEDGDFHHPTDCKMFYRCKDGFHELKECPDGMLFDNAMRECYDEDQVNCGNRQRPTTTENPCELWLKTSPSGTPPLTQTTAKPVTNTGGMTVATETEEYTTANVNSTDTSELITSVNTNDTSSGSTVEETRNTGTDDISIVGSTSTEIIGTATSSSSNEIVSENTSSGTTENYTGSTGANTNGNYTETIVSSSTEIPQNNTTTTEDAGGIVSNSTEVIVETSSVITESTQNGSETTPVNVTDETISSNETTDSVTLAPNSSTTTMHPCLTYTPKSHKPRGPPHTHCKKHDVNCIIKETGDINKWFTCPTKYGIFPHPSSNLLFIHCFNGIPAAKKCAKGFIFSTEYLVCVLPEGN